jgi:uroporphyrin-III C-methyltransferase/precorrin-2 dehydrogenase/sirohydrochlorin ferrochelatase
MRFLPAFLNLDGGTVIIAGGGELALRKARLVAQSGAALTIFTGDGAPRADFDEETLGAAKLRQGLPTLEDLTENCRLLIAATGSDECDERLAALARQARVPVNVVDRPELCDVTIPSIVRRGDLVIGISTGGAAPVLGRRLREHLEAKLPARLGDVIGFAKERRPRVGALPPQERRAFWERFFGGSAERAVLEGDQDEAERIFQEELQGRKQGHVAIVGAGPGDPELLTLKALRFCQEADVILHDNLVPEAILDLCRRDADRVYVGKKRADHSLPQEDICALMISLAREGKRVVRLKGGDPFIFGRGGEELFVLKKAGVATTVVPGISAAMGCAARASLPLTHRGVSPSVTFVTAEAGRSSAAHTNWDALAKAGGTLVVYMGVAKAAEVASRLVAGGLSASTPAVVIADGTRPTERIIRTDLSGLGEAAARVNAPALLIIGEVAALDQQPALPAFLEEIAA